MIQKKRRGKGRVNDLKLNLRTPTMMESKVGALYKNKQKEEMREEGSKSDGGVNQVRCGGGGGRKGPLRYLY